MKLANRSCRFCFFLNCLEVLFEPKLEVAGLARVSKNKAGRSLHGFLRDGGEYASRLFNDFHATVVGGQHRALYSGHWDIEFALSMLAINQQRTRDTDGYLRDTPKVFNVAFHFVRVKGEPFCVIQ